jgi:hypothetical protein
MEIAFQSRELRSLCEDERVAAAQLDPAVVVDLKARLADLRAAGSVSDLVAGRPAITGDSQEILTLTLCGQVTMTLVPNHPAHPPLDEQGRVDWNRVRRLRVTDLLPEGDCVS